MQCSGPLSRRFSSKLHAITTSQGKPLHIILTPGQQHDSTEAEHLIEHATGKALVADAGTTPTRSSARSGGGA